MNSKPHYHRTRRQVYELLKERDGLTCGICKGSLEENWERYELWLSSPSSKLVKRKVCDITVDHIYPRSLIRRAEGFVYHPGWAYDDMENLQLAHWKCNNEKGNRTS